MLYCRHNLKLTGMGNRTCTSCKKDFFIAPEDEVFYEKFKVSNPTKCPSCRDRTRLTFRNERYYYQGNCALCKKQIISVYDPVFVKNVYCHECFWSDKWDSSTYRRDFDFGKSFFKQYKELLKDVPKLAMMNDNGTGSENCEYTYDVAFAKDCYLVLAAWYIQDCMYGFQINHDKDCVDNYFVNESQLMYNCVSCENSYNCQDLLQCSESTDCMFCFDLKNCKNCLFCSGLRNKQYHILNKQYSKEEYSEKLAAINIGSWKNREKYRQEFLKFIANTPRRYANFINCDGCTGDNLVNSKNAIECYNYRGLHDCKWMANGDIGKDSYECYSSGNCELCYDCITPDNGYNVMMSVFCWKCKFVAYSDNCHSCQNLFGCVGMKRKNFCILNKQYSEKEYFALREKIIDDMKKSGEYGEFFPADLCPFAYNETSAQEWHPLDEKSVIDLGYRWQKNLPGSFGKETIRFENISDDIKNISTDGDMGNGKIVWKEIFRCDKCEKSFKIVQKEFLFYKKLGIPLPHLCIDCRYYYRKSLMNPLVLHDRECMCETAGHDHSGKCKESFKTSYAPERKEKVYCENCYNKTMYLY